MATTKREFLVFSPDQRLSVVREVLRQAEESYYRATINAPGGPVPGGVDTAQESLDEQWARVEELQAEYKAVEKESSSG